MLNTCVIIGRLTRDPESRTVGNDISLTEFGLAVERDFRNKDGEKETDFFSVVCWRGLADTVANHLGKGRLVAVQGRLQQDRWQQDGQGRSKITIQANSVQFLDWPEKNEAPF